MALPICSDFIRIPSCNRIVSLSKNISPMFKVPRIAEPMRLIHQRFKLCEMTQCLIKTLNHSLVVLLIPLTDLRCNSKITTGFNCHID